MATEAPDAGTPATPPPPVLPEPAGRREWDEPAIAALLDLYTEKYLWLQKGRRGTLKARDWQEVVERLNEVCAHGRSVYSYMRCKNKLDSLKKTYKTVKDKRRAGLALKWKWFDRVERIMPLVIVAEDRDRDRDRDIAEDSCSKRMRFSENLEQSLGLGFEECRTEVTGTSVGNRHVQQLQMQMQLQTQMMHYGVNRDIKSLGNELLRNDTVMEGDSLAAGLGPGMGLYKGGLMNGDSGAQEGAKRESRKRKKIGPGKHAKELARMVIEALEKIEEKRLKFEEKRMEVMRELDIKRTETHLQIAKLIMECNMHSRYHGMPSQQYSAMSKDI